MYASKRRQRNFKRVRDTTKRANEPSNPSKRHRERLNGELETVASLLPYDEHIIQRLDKLSVLRLAVSFLHIKAHFQVCTHMSLIHGGQCPHHPLVNTYLSTTAPINMVPSLTDYRMPIVDPQEPTFGLLAQKSDVLHQSLYEMIHSEDRESLRQSLLVADSSDCTFDQSHRNVVARFRCLLDNTCGFIRVEIKGRLMVLHSSQTTSSYIGPNQQPDALRYALVAICTPFVPPLQMNPNLDDPILKTKHWLDLSLFSMDNRLRVLLEMNEPLSIASTSTTSLRSLNQSFYALIHPEDVKFVEEAHDAVIKYCSSGLMIYRLIERVSGVIYYIQSSFRLFFKNGKPETIGGNHRLLTEVDGHALLKKRASLKFKYVSFDDTLLQSPRIFPTQFQQTSLTNIEGNLVAPQALNIADCEPSTSNYKTEACYYGHNQNLPSQNHMQNYHSSCNPSKNMHPLHLSTSNLNQQNPKERKNKYASEYASHHSSDMKPAQKNNILTTKKKIKKQITKRQSCKKQNVEKITTSTPSSSAIPCHTSLSAIPNESHLKQHLINNVSSTFHQQMFHQKKHQIDLSAATNLATPSGANNLSKTNETKTALLNNETALGIATNNSNQIVSAISNNKLAISFANNSSNHLISSEVCNTYTNFVDTTQNNLASQGRSFTSVPTLPTIDLTNGADLLMNADYLGHYYQYYYPSTTNHTATQKLFHYPQTNHLWQDYCYTNGNTLLAGNQDYFNGNAGTYLTELLDASANNTSISNQLAVAHLISNGYPVTTTVPNTNLSYNGSSHPSTNEFQRIEPEVLKNKTASNSNGMIPPFSNHGVFSSNGLHDGQNHYYSQISHLNQLTPFGEMNSLPNGNTFMSTICNNYNVNNYNSASTAAAYAAVAMGSTAAAAASNGFNFLSEVANTLLGQ